MSQTLKRNALTIMLVALFAFVGVSTSLAAEPTGNSPDQALTAGKSHSLQAGERVWYAFEYNLQYDDKSPLPVSIWLDSEPDGNTTNFEVWTAERLSQWQAKPGGDDNVNPLGRGSQNDNTPGDHFWTGEFYEAGIYYVKVSNESLAPSYYTLHIEGEGVKAIANETEMIEVEVEEVEVEVIEVEVEVEVEVVEVEVEVEVVEVEVEVEVVEVEVEVEVVEVEVEAEVEAEAEAMIADGSTLNKALVINGEWMALESGQSVWYMFEYTYDHKDTQRASIWLENEFDNANTNFGVWTPELLSEWQVQQDNNVEVKPVGRGNQDDNTPGDHFWSGAFYQSGTYYVKVTNESSRTNYYALNLELSK